MLNEIEKNNLKTLLQDPRWQTFQRFVELTKENIRSGSSLRDTEWETLKAVLTKEGQIQGINHLIQEMLLNAK